jgi:pentatricopeptide repeat protein
MKLAGLIPNDITYNSLIDIAVRTNNMQKAHEIYEEMKSASISPDN